MGALPKRKLSKGRKNRRRFADKLTVKSLSKCLKCGARKRTHFECPNCGYYKEEIKKETK